LFKTIAFLKGRRSPIQKIKKTRRKERREGKENFKIRKPGKKDPFNCLTIQKKINTISFLWEGKTMHQRWREERYRGSKSGFGESHSPILKSQERAMKERGCRRSQSV